MLGGQQQRQAGSVCSQGEACIVPVGLSAGVRHGQAGSVHVIPVTVAVPVEMNGIMERLHSGGVEDQDLLGVDKKVVKAPLGKHVLESLYEMQCGGDSTQDDLGNEVPDEVVVDEAIDD